MKKSLNSFVLLASLLLTGCTKEGDTIYQPNPNEEQPASLLSTTTKDRT